jgi:hypothetical protein
MTTPSEHDRGAFWSGVVIGGAVCVYGLHGLIPALHGVTSRQFVQWFLGADLTHDLVVAPVACVVGLAIARLTSRGARAPVRAAVFASAIVIAVAWAPLRGYGRAVVPDNASVAPLDYSTAVLTVVAAVWTIAAGWFVAGRLRRRRVSRRPGAGSCTG